MTGLFGALKLVRLWQWLPLLIVFAGAAGGTYGGYLLVASPDDASLAEDQQLVPVVRDDLVTSIAVNGSLVFPNTESLRFDSQGALGDLLVIEGETVAAGQPVAALDQATVASLEKDLAQARVDLEMAKEALEEIHSPSAQLEIVKAESKVANARVAVLDSWDKLRQLFTPPTDYQLAQAESAVAKARLGIDSAQEALDSLISGPDQDTIDALLFQIESAQIVLDNAQRDRSLVLDDWNGKLAAAEDAISPLEDEYVQLFLKWLDIDAERVDAYMEPEMLLTQWGVSLEILFDPSARFLDIRRGRLSQGPPPDDPNTPWSEGVIYAWANLSPYDIQPTCDADSTGSNVLCIQAELSDSWDKLESARADLHTLQTQAEKAKANAENSVAKADESLQDATDKLDDFSVDADPIEVESKVKELALAKASFDEAESELADLQEQASLAALLEERGANLSTGDGIHSAMLPIDAMSESMALGALAGLKDVELAEAKLFDAEESLTELINAVPDSQLVALREAELTAAELDLEAAEQRIEEAVLTSPISGVVTEISVDSGENVGPNTAIMTVVDSTVVEVDGVVDEIDVLSIQIGAAASVTMDALPGQFLPGTVSYISAEADNQQGIVTYQVSIRVETPAGIVIREGLTAVAQLVLSSELDVLLIPLQAVRGSFSQPTTLVFQDGVLTERPVATGASDDFWVVVGQGLVEGELVVMEGGGTSNFGFLGGGLGGGAGFGELRGPLGGGGRR